MSDQGDIMLEDKNVAAQAEGDAEPDAPVEVGPRTRLQVCCSYYGLTAQTLTGVFAGFILGIILNEAKPTSTWIKVLAYPGDLFIQALKMVVVPLIFTSMILAVIKLGDIGKIKVIGKRALAYYTVTTFIAAFEGLVWVNIFQPGLGGPVTAASEIGPFATCHKNSTNFCMSLFQLAPEEDWNTTEFQSSCGDFSSTMLNGTTASQAAGFCKTLTMAVASNAMISSDINAVVEMCHFMTTAVCGSLPEKETIDAFLDIGLSALPPNIIEAFLNTNIIGIIVFALLFGFFINKQENNNSIMEVFSVANAALMEIVNLIILFTPYGICSLVASQVSAQTDLWADLAQLGVFIAATMVGILIHAYLVYPAIYYGITRENPYKVLMGLGAPMCTAFATSSSAATLPVTIRTVEALGVHEDISRFMLPLGATINMDGTAIYFPIAVIFIANWTGQGPLMFAEQISIAFVSAFVSIGAAPIPSAGLVYLILIMNSANIQMSAKVSLVLAVDWLLDRMQTMCNVTGDAMGANILQHLRNRDEAKAKAN